MAQEAINIKGTKHGLVIILNPSYSFEDLKIKLQDKIVSAKGFFKGAKFTLMSPKISIEESQELKGICCEYGLIPCDAIELPQAVGSNINSIPAKIAQKIKEPLAKETDNCLLLTHSLRSGQTVNYDGHITILGDVNAGAEIMATGNILVMGTLRGVVHAGVTGNTAAIIVAYRLEPDQIRISEFIARSPEKTENHSYPERAYLNGNNIIIEPYPSNVGNAKIKALL